MDIMLPPLRQQVSPAPWLNRQRTRDLAGLIQKALAENPSATVDQVVERLTRQGDQVSAVVVAMWMRKLGQAAAEPAQAADEAPSR